jgi:hypothetical protein
MVTLVLAQWRELCNIYNWTKNNAKIPGCQTFQRMGFKGFKLRGKNED